MSKSKPKYYIVYWILFFLTLVSLSAIYDGDILGGIYLNLTRIPLLFILAYLVFNVINVKSEWNNFKKGTFILITLITAVFVSRLLFAYLVYPYHFKDNYSFTFFNWYRIVSQFVIFIAGLGGYGLLIYYTEKEAWKKKQIELEQAKHNSELNFLKAQVQPHFLHNTLNGIYNEVIKKSDKAGDMIIKLSELMRFMLHEGKHDFIQVAKEMELIENYVELELLRFGNQVKVSRVINDVYLNYKVPPLLFFSLIENSFKHGVSYLSNNSYIKYELDGDNDKLIFKVENSIGKEYDRHSVESTGIGLKNINRQLQLIYGDNYELIQHKEKDCFTSTLIVPNYAQSF